MDINAIFEKLNAIIDGSGLTEENFNGGTLPELLDEINAALANANDESKRALGVAAVIIGNLFSALVSGDQALELPSQPSPLELGDGN